MKKFLLALVVSAIPFVSVAEDKPSIPKMVEKGDTVALVSPARSIDHEKAETIETGLNKLGINVWKSKNLHSKHGYLAGTDEERAGEIMRAWKDPEVDALFCVAGGYGCNRVLDLLDYDYIRDNPKVITGFSDITALHLALYKKANIVTFHSTSTSYTLSGNCKARPYATKSFWQTVAPSLYEEVVGVPLKEGPILYTDDQTTTPSETFNPGVAWGRLVGGNLSLIASLMGTPYEMETEGHIVFFEEVGEKPYRVDRMFSTLELAGKLDNPAAVILGQFADCVSEHPDTSFTMDELIERYFGDKTYPIIKNFPVGHVRENATLPIGLMAELDATNRQLTLLELRITN